MIAILYYIVRTEKESVIIQEGVNYCIKEGILIHEKGVKIGYMLQKKLIIICKNTLFTALNCLLHFWLHISNLVFFLQKLI